MSSRNFVDNNANPQTADALDLLLPVLAARALNYPAIFPSTVSAPENPRRYATAHPRPRATFPAHAGQGLRP
ncbi:MAG: hypothetical protein WDN28_22520 [Chthoniobacter sp.]